MKALIFHTYFLTIFLNSFGQSQAMFQPDSIYRNNSVKSRIVSFDSGGTKGVLIYDYDKKGRLINYGLTDIKTGKGYQFKIIYNYDSTNKIKTEVKLVANRTKTHTKYFYDSNGLQTSKYTFNEFKNIIEKDTIQYNPYSETQTFLNADTVIRQQTAIYDDGYLFAYTRFFGYEYIDGEKNDWDYSFINSFDTHNKIIKRESNVQGRRTTYFEYNNRGLLIKTIEKSKVPNGFSDWVSYVRYKYWQTY